jgi:DNA-binding NarL/FixJ family response regulator
MLRILLADDHEVVRRGLREHLAGHEGWEICGEASDGNDAVRMALALLPDVVVLDLSMPGLNGLEATRRIRRELPTTEVLMLTMHDTEHLVREVLAAGALGYVLKSDAGRYLTSAVQALSDHKPYFTAQISPAVLDAYLKSKAKPDEPGLFRTLSERERQTLKLLAEGHTEKEISDRLAIPVASVAEDHAAVMRKLELDSLTELVHYAVRNRLIKV